MTVLFRWPRIPAWLYPVDTKIETKYGVFWVDYKQCNEGCYHKQWFRYVRIE